ncbi:hypothetical protein [Segniliparus rotundus]|uniref:hypothetical protein n=1 Tax=Segniliparus rotundus TaxID=286802 RepID=UPI0002E3A360|nr:hypothetical protein [Segniliparus rotundus]
MSYDERFFHFDRAGVRITPERLEELEGDWRYVHLRVTETSRYKVATRWSGKISAGFFRPDQPPPPVPARPKVFVTTTLALFTLGDQYGAKLVAITKHDKEDDAVAGHDRAVEEAEANYPKQG